MNELIIRQFDSRDIRIIFDENNEPHFVVQDVLKELGIKNQRHALRKLKESQRGVTNLTTLGGKQQFATVTESGLYALVFQSRKNSAIAFQDWVTDEVIPSIRKTGSYSIEPKKELSPLDILENHVRQMRFLEQANANLSTQIQAVALEAKQEHDTLTHDQIKEMSSLLASLKDASGDVKDCGRGMKMLKARFGLTGMNNWKEMPRHGFEEAKRLVLSYRDNLQVRQTMF